MHAHMNSRIFPAALVALVCLCLAPLGAEEVFPFLSMDSSFAGEAKLPEFARKSLAEFSTFTLSNGIPVIVKHNGGNRIQHISLILRGGTLLADPAMAITIAIAADASAEADEQKDDQHDHEYQTQGHEELRCMLAGRSLSGPGTGAAGMGVLFEPQRQRSSLRPR